MLSEIFGLYSLRTGTFFKAGTNLIDAKKREGAGIFSSKAAIQSDELSRLSRLGPTATLKADGDSALEGAARKKSLPEPTKKAAPAAEEESAPAAESESNPFASGGDSSGSNNPFAGGADAEAADEGVVDESNETFKAQQVFRFVFLSYLCAFIVFNWSCCMFVSLRNNVNKKKRKLHKISRKPILSLELERDKNKNFTRVR